MLRTIATQSALFVVSALTVALVGTAVVTAQESGGPSEAPGFTVVGSLQEAEEILAFPLKEVILPDSLSAMELAAIEVDETAKVVTHIWKNDQDGSWLMATQEPRQAGLLNGEPMEGRMLGGDAESKYSGPTETRPYGVLAMAWSEGEGRGFTVVGSIQGAVTEAALIETAEGLAQ